MALQPEDEPPVRGLESLDEVAGRTARPGVGDETRREVLRPDRLVVIRVDPDDPAAAVGREQDPREPGPGRDAERMDERRALAPARTLVPVDVLEERPAGERR